VGGTSLTKASNARGWSEAVWSGTGSGCSRLIAQPSWQNYATNQNTYSAYNNTSCLKRIETDISAVADPTTGVAVYGPSGIATRSAWLVFGGTSVAAPLIGGMYGTKGGVSSGTVGPQQIWVNAPSGLNDVTTGSNGSCVAYCAAGVGYDSPSGNGTPNGTGGL